jgi:S-DNA-T family DNA segregation ATPase FtsK/SpoIIIE
MKSQVERREGGPGRDLKGLIVVGLGVFGVLSLLSPSMGVAGVLAARALRWFLGGVAPALPVIAVVWGLLMVFLDRGDLPKGRLAGGLLAVGVVAGLLHLRYPAGLEFEYAGRGLGGGVLGAAVDVTLLRVVGATGRRLVLGLLGLASVLTLTQWTIGRFGRAVIAALKLFARGAVNLWDEIAELAGGARDTGDTGAWEHAGERAGQAPRATAEGEAGDKGSSRPADAEAGGARRLSVLRGGGEDRTAPAERPRGAPGTAVLGGDLLLRSDGSGAGSGAPVSGGEDEKYLQVTMPAHVMYRLPPLGLLTLPGPSKFRRDQRGDAGDKAALLEQTLASFGVEAKVVNVSRGPTITRFELTPGIGVKVSRITSLEDDLALKLAAQYVRIEAPVPGKSVIGIEVPNREVSPVVLREVIESSEFRNAPGKLVIALGKDITGRPVVGDLTRMLHVLIAGSTGSGKSVCINTIITSLLFKARPDEVRFLMIDPKVVELTNYNGIPHLVAPVVTDPRKAASALKWVVHEMMRRYESFAASGVRDIGRYNTWAQQRPGTETLPYIVVIIDELADLMLVARADVEDAIQRLAQMARAAGIHLIVATQRPSVDVITGVIKANIPSRIAFAVSSQVDSRTIFDINGAEKLLGRGDMLYWPVGEGKPIRAQGAFVSDPEVEALVSYARKQAQPAYVDGVFAYEPGAPADSAGADDVLLRDAVRTIIETGQASTSMLQRRLRVGYTRAARLMDMMEERGIVGRPDGSRPREILLSLDQYARLFKAEDEEPPRKDR